MADTDYDTTEAAEGHYESKAESDKSRSDFVARWLAEIDLASKQEEKWRDEAEKTRELYRAEKSGAKTRFNIVYSNVETEVPALFNSIPIPDVRTRYQDEDEVSRLACQAIERLLSYSVDTYPFDTTIKSAVQDRQLTGRGSARVRYMPYEYQGKFYQEVSCEHTAWKHRRQGPCTRWDDLPWLAYEHFLTREQLLRLDKDKGMRVQLDVSLSETMGGKQNKPDIAANVFKRGRVWEIWDKATRKVLWIAPSFAADVVHEVDDPLGLIDFFPEPEPMYAIKTSDSMVPVVPYRIIKPLADELEEITIRIQQLIKVCRWRGFRHPAIPSFELLSEAEDGELVAPMDGSEVLSLVTGGGLDKFIWLMPIGELIKVIQQLSIRQQEIIQTIYMVSGVADIMRGQTDPQETLGAQEIKANFGTMRLQDSQKDVARFCRDLFRLKAEIACNKFDSQNLLLMTGMKQPSRAEVMQAKQQLQMMQRQAQMAQMPAPPPQPPPPPMGGPQRPPQLPPPQMLQ